VKGEGLLTDKLPSHDTSTSNIISQKEMQQKMTYVNNDNGIPVSINPPTAEEIRECAISYVRRKKIVAGPDYSQRIQIIYVSSPRFLSLDSCDVDVISTFRVYGHIEEKFQVIPFNKTLKISCQMNREQTYFELSVFQESPIV